MRHHPSRALNMRTLFVVLFLLMLGGCAAPKHTNTLIFGTTTSFALAASEDPTGSLGITIGYKRNEAVFMPLLANKAMSGTSDKQVPAECESKDNDKCPKFTGLGSADGPAGQGAVDTYSVLATFAGSGGASSTTANGVKTEGTIAQFFATGLAARLLAEKGGAALVNPSAEPSVTASASGNLVPAPTIDLAIQLNTAITAPTLSLPAAQQALTLLGDPAAAADLPAARGRLMLKLRQATTQPTQAKVDAALGDMRDKFKTAGMLS